jgi:hypothetical protein
LPGVKKVCPMSAVLIGQTEGLKVQEDARVRSRRAFVISASSVSVSVSV